MRRILKLKYNGSRVEIRYDTEREDGADPDEYELKSGDAPRAGMAKALGELPRHVCALCDLPPAYAVGMSARGITLSHTDDILGVVVTCMKPVKGASGPLIINSPHVPAEQYSPTGSSPLMTEEFCAAVEAVIEEAEAYLDGDRAQGLLPGMKGAVADEAAPAEGKERVDEETGEVIGEPAGDDTSDAAELKCGRCGAHGKGVSLITLSASGPGRPAKSAGPICSKCFAKLPAEFAKLGRKKGRKVSA